MASNNMKNAAFRKAVQQRMAKRGIKPFPASASRKKRGGMVSKTAAPVQGMASGRLGPKPAAPGTPAQATGIAGAAQRKLRTRRMASGAFAQAMKKPVAKK